MPVYGPYHAPHLHGTVDIDQILPSTDSRLVKLLSTYKLALPLVSSSSGDCFEEDLDAPQVLTAVIKDMLSEPLKLHDIIAGCKDLLNASECRECEIVSLGPNDSESMLARALNSGTNAQVTLRINSPADILSEGLISTRHAPRTSRRTKLAIVGMAGRFPNAADHEKFWDLLEAGLDVHRRV